MLLQTSNFVATNNEDFKILKNMVDFYLRYKKKVIQCRCNQITLNGIFLKRLKKNSVFTSSKKILYLKLNINVNLVTLLLSRVHKLYKYIDWLLSRNIYDKGYYLLYMDTRAVN